MDDPTRCGCKCMRNTPRHPDGIADYIINKYMRGLIERGCSVYSVVCQQRKSSHGFKTHALPIVPIYLYTHIILCTYIYIYMISIVHNNITIHRCWLVGEGVRWKYRWLTGTRPHKIVHISTFDKCYYFIARKHSPNDLLLFSNDLENNV